MESEAAMGFLDQLWAKVEARWEEVDPERRFFLKGLGHLQRGEVEEASRVFRRGARTLAAPFDTMSGLAHGRCEVIRGRHGVALRIFRALAMSSAPGELRRLAWMEVADLARERDDGSLLEQARQAIRAERGSADGIVQE